MHESVTMGLVLAIGGLAGMLWASSSAIPIEVFVPQSLKTQRSDATGAAVLASPSSESRTAEIPATNEKCEGDSWEFEEYLSERPSDPIEVGECGLRLILADYETDALLDGDVQLWRLGAPETPYWTAGDQLQASARVEGGSAVFAGLPQGEYRVVFLGAAEGADYADAFHVEGRSTTQRVRVRAPLAIDTYLELFDTSGERVQELEYSWRSPQIEYSEAPLPPWLVERRLRRGEDGFTGWERVLLGARACGGQPESLSSRAGERGFLLGTFLENTRVCSTGLSLAVRVPERGRGYVHLRRMTAADARFGEARFAGVFVSQAELSESLASSHAAHELVLAKKMYLQIYPVVVGGAQSELSWQDSSIRVNVIRARVRTTCQLRRPRVGRACDPWVEVRSD